MSTETSFFTEEKGFNDSIEILFRSDGQCARNWLDLIDTHRVSVYETHGIWMWVAWVPLGFALIATKRYIKGQWKLMHILHAVLGFVVLAVTLW